MTPEEQLPPEEQLQADFLKELEDKFKVGSKELDAISKMEIELSNPDNNIKTALDAMKFLEDSELTKYQLMLMVIRNHSRANDLTNKLEEFTTIIREKQKEISILLKQIP